MRDRKEDKKTEREGERNGEIAVSRCCAREKKRDRSVGEKGTSQPGARERNATEKAIGGNNPDETNLSADPRM